jgi:hypothetical protein
LGDPLSNVEIWKQLVDFGPEFEVDDLLSRDDAGARIMRLLTQKYPSVRPSDAKGLAAWLASGAILYEAKRYYEALDVYWAFYQKLFTADARMRKAEPLLRISDCFSALGFPVHAKRYRMLALCETATLRGGGPFDAAEHLTVFNIYSRLVWGGLTEEELKRYAKNVFELAQRLPQDEIFPEALLLRILDDNWAIELPSVNEVMYYRANPVYVRYLISKLGDESGETLEFLAQYLMSCMPGCRARRRLKTPSTDHDIVCAMEGFDLDFRSELGRHFVCECKDWDRPADFTTMAKFCRVLDSTKSRFGILFSKGGISGKKDESDAARERLKIFQDRGVIIVVLDLQDLNNVAGGANLIALLRSRYEEMRLDLLPGVQESGQTPGIRQQRRKRARP